MKQFWFIIFILIFSSNAYSFVLTEGNEPKSDHFEVVQTSYEEKLGIQEDSSQTRMVFDDYVSPEIRSAKTERMREKNRITNMIKVKEAEKKKLNDARLSKVQNQLVLAKRIKQEVSKETDVSIHSGWPLFVLGFLGLLGVSIAFRRGSRLMNYLDEE